jgi:hypothetical protein
MARTILDLPEEILFEIFGLLLVHDEPISVTYIPKTQCPAPDAISVLLISKKAHRIAAHILYHKNTFKFSSEINDLPLFLSRLSGQGYKAISRVMTCWIRGTGDFTPSLDLLLGCKSLTSLEIDFLWAENLQGAPRNSEMFSFKACEAYQCRGWPELGESLLAYLW